MTSYSVVKKKIDDLLVRYDGILAAYYFSPLDFPEIKSEKFNVKGSKGILRGNFYFYDDFNADKFIIFDHGIGAGHLAYFKEIEYLARNGYTVYSYDHTGCVESDGDGIGGFAQGVCDLDHVVTAIENEKRFEGKDIKVMGHSWGGYSVMNVVSKHPEITHVVSLSGFISARSFIEMFLLEDEMKYIDKLMEEERSKNPEYADLNAIESLKNSKAKFLYVQSEDDNIVKYDKCEPVLKEALKDREGTYFVTMTGRGHNPQYMDEAVVALNKMQADLISLTEKNKLNSKKEQEDFKNSQDWDLITKQDDKLWDKIICFLDEK